VDGVTGFMKASKEVSEQGTFAEFANGHPGGELDKMFGQGVNSDIA
jgi:hypothetical protein